MDKIKPSERKFINEYIKDGDAVRAVIDTDKRIVSEESAEQLAKKHLNNKTIQELADTLLGNALLVVKHAELLEQTKTVVQYDPKTGQIIAENTDIPDTDVRLKALDMAYKLRGLYAPEKRQTVNLNIETNSVDPDVIEMTKKYEEDLKKLYINKQPNGQDTNNSNEEAR